VQLWAVPAAGPSGWLNTYYVYDDLNNLRFVIPPAAEQWLQGQWLEFCRYWREPGCSWSFVSAMSMTIADHMSIKKVPGAGESWMVYDGRDRLVMSQDSNLRVLGKWLVSEFDSQNRPDSAGLITDGHNLTYHQNLAVNSSYYPVVASYPYSLQTETLL
jgi:hypothetical protein